MCIRDRRFVVTMDLVVCMLQFHAAPFQLDLHQRKAVDENRHVIAALFTSLDSDLVGYLEFVLAPLFLIEEFHPNPVAILRFQRIEVS